MKQEIITATEFKKQNQIRTAKRVKVSGSNQLTKNIIQFLAVNGFEVWRSNVTGIFDIKLAVKVLLKRFKIVLSTRQLPTSKNIETDLRKCYRKSHERKGVSDIMGFEKKTGRFIAVEVKYGKDKLSIHQIDFLERVVKNNCIAIVSKTFDQFVKDLHEGNYFKQ